MTPFLRPLFTNSVPRSARIAHGILPRGFQVCHIICNSLDRLIFGLQELDGYVVGSIVIKIHDGVPWGIRLFSFDVPLPAHTKVLLVSPMCRPCCSVSVHLCQLGVL